MVARQDRKAQTEYTRAKWRREISQGRRVGIKLDGRRLDVCDLPRTGRNSRAGEGRGSADAARVDELTVGRERELVGARASSSRERERNSWLVAAVVGMAVDGASRSKEQRG